MKKMTLSAAALLLALASLASAAAPASATAASPAYDTIDLVTVRFDAAGASGVSGTATLNEEDGGTTVEFDLAGLVPGSTAAATLSAGSCALPGASTAALATLKADAAGETVGSGSVLFRGTEKVELTAVADGAHIITISVDGATVACGVVPSLAASASAAVGMPRTGVASGYEVALLIAIASAIVVIAGVRLSRARAL